MDGFCREIKIYSDVSHSSVALIRVFYGFPRSIMFLFQRAIIQ
jgi:hypothetical protein